MSKSKTAKPSVKRSADKKNSPPSLTPSEAQRLAAGILEVLAGLRSPPAAAERLSISLPRYYQLEARALEGLVAALAPRPLGKQPALENRIKQLEKELDAARRECARQEALVRLTQRSLGLAMPSKPSAQTTAPGAKRKPRRPAVRALRAAEQLRAQADQTAAGVSGETSLQPTAPESSAQEACS